MNNYATLNYGQQAAYPQQYGQQPYMGGYYDPNYGYQPYVVNQPLIPQTGNALSNEEIQILRNARPQTLDINIDENDKYRAICTHKDTNGRSVVTRTNDGNVYCPICGAVWKPIYLGEEELKEHIDAIHTQIENMKWIGDLPTNVVRDFCVVDPVLQLMPKLSKYSADTFNKYYSQTNIVSANDATGHNSYNSLFGSGYGMGGYGQVQPAPGYYQQQYMPAQPQSAGDIYFNQTQQYPPQTTSPYVNPMQAPPQMPYGVNPAAPNQQFVNQAANMMTPPAQPQAYQPQPAPGYVGMQQQPVAQPVQTAQPQQQATFATPQAYQPQAQAAPVDNKPVETNQQTINI